MQKTSHFVGTCKSYEKIHLLADHNSFSQYLLQHSSNFHSFHAHRLIPQYFLSILLTDACDTERQHYGAYILGLATYTSRLMVPLQSRPPTQVVALESLAIVFLGFKAICATTSTSSKCISKGCLYSPHQGALVFNCTPCHCLMRSPRISFTSLCCLMTDKPVNFGEVISSAYIEPHPPLMSWTW